MGTIEPIPPHNPSIEAGNDVGNKVVLSLIACFIWISMGGLVGLLGPSIPAISKHLGMSETQLGGAFAFRAGGYIIGSMLISRLPERGTSKVSIMAIAGLVASALNIVIPKSDAITILFSLCLVQGIGLSFISTLGNIVLLELWGSRAGPWLQALHLSFGIGAILSSLLLGIAGMNVAFYAFAAVGLGPFVAVVLVEGISGLKRTRTLSSSSSGGEQREEAEIEKEGGMQSMPTGAGNGDSDVRVTDEYSLEESTQRHHRYGSRGHGRRLTLESIMPFQETVMAVSLHEDGLIEIVDPFDGAGQTNEVLIATDLNISHQNGYSKKGTTTSTQPSRIKPLPASTKWLLTLFLGVYVGAESGFGSWISTFVLLEGTTVSESRAAFLVSIFWAAVTIGRAVAVGQAIFIGPSWSLRWQLLLSLVGASAFFAIGASSFKGAAVSAAIYGYGMSSVYPLGMTWPSEVSLSLDTAITAHLVIGGCVGEAAVPLMIGLAMHVMGPEALPLTVLGLIIILALTFVLIESLGRTRLKREQLSERKPADHVVVDSEISSLLFPVASNSKLSDRYTHRASSNGQCLAMQQDKHGKSPSYGGTGSSTNSGTKIPNVKTYSWIEI